MSNPILEELDRLFALQVFRIKSYLNPTVHSPGDKKPNLTQQEAILLGEEEADELTEG